jgi:hypothetical protein
MNTLCSVCRNAVRLASAFIQMGSSVIGIARSFGYNAVDCRYVFRLSQLCDDWLVCWDATLRPSVVPDVSRQFVAFIFSVFHTS